ncbi:hypothetical protein K0M31_007289 [Melipona bicolor]|uniref:Uncharacterized protein n=1 Tax=Melipona bicolor TaxID=60889 RepID=A0AA40GBE7_9HYME|nr:hypothetical protein K0M31_007289 [Melipona bicolor]
MRFIGGTGESEEFARFQRQSNDRIIRGASVNDEQREKYPEEKRGRCRLDQRGELRENDTSSGGRRYHYDASRTTSWD